MNPLQRAEIADRLKDRRQAVAELTRQGLSTNQIAKQLGVATRTVERDRVAAGVAQPRWPFWTEAEHRRALELIEDGASLREVADTLGRGYYGVCDRFHGLGWTNAQTGEFNRMRVLWREIEV